ncbi:hypothetical protein Ancab_013352 [Ancistrocladus abbreviatus]
MIPAISKLIHTWTTVFGFSVVEESHKQEIKSINMLAFPGTDMLQKKLVEQESLKRDITLFKGMVSPKVDVIVPGSTDKSDRDVSHGDGPAAYHSEASTEVPELEKSSLNFPPKHDIEVSTDCKEEHITAIQEAKVTDADSGSQPGCVYLNFTSFRNTPLHFSEAIKHPSEGNGNSTSRLVDELVFEVKYPLALNAYHVALVGKWLLDPPTAGNIEQPLLECEGDGAHEVDKKIADSSSVSKVQDLFIKDAANVNYCLKAYNRYKLEVSSQETVRSHSQTRKISSISC